MVVVMPLGYAIQSFWAGPAKTASATAPLAGRPRPGALSLFGQDLLERRDADDRARLQGVASAPTIAPSPASRWAAARR